jgi:hypothetical protein
MCCRVRQLLKSGRVCTFVNPDPSQCYTRAKQASCSKCSSHVPASAASNPVDSQTGTLLRHMQKDGWTTETSELPQTFSYMHIQEHARKTGKSMPGGKSVEKPLERGYRFFSDNYVHSVKCARNVNTIFASGKCFRSMKKSEAPHSVHVSLELNADVRSASCSCVAGELGYCNHVIGLLYYIEHTTRFGAKEFGKSRTCTELPCTWNKSRTEGVRAEPVMMCNFSKPQYGSSASGIKSTLYEARAPAARRTL